MKKILVLATGWHFSSHFYEKMAQQIIPEGWHADYFCVAHRPPDDKNTIQEKANIRESDAKDFLGELDKILYEYPITVDQIESFGWKFMLEENTIGDMEVFNQWSDKYDYTEYDIILITHDDNFILSDKIFVDVVSENSVMFKPIVESRYGWKGHQFKVASTTNNNNWYFLDNGYTESIPKAFTPRGSFSFYKKELIDLLPNNKFDMTDVVLTREGLTDSPGHMELNSWNTNAGNFRDFLYNSKNDLELVDKTRWLSMTRRVSKYCIEGERGFVSNRNADGNQYVNAVQSIMEKLGWI